MIQIRAVPLLSGTKHLGKSLRSSAFCVCADGTALIRLMLTVLAHGQGGLCALLNASGMPRFF